MYVTGIWFFYVALVATVALVWQHMNIEMRHKLII